MRWVYILECEDGFYYVGETTRLYKRFWQHTNGNGGINTEMFPPMTIVAIYPLYKMGRFFDYIDHVISNEFSIYFNNYYYYTDFNDINGDNDEQYDMKMVENNIAETMMIHNPDNWTNIRGGKYVRFDCNYSFPKNEIVSHLPLCKCLLPCDVKRNSENTYFYFRCAKKNIYEDLFNNVDIDIDTESCDFFLKYTQDCDYISNYKSKQNEIIQLTYKSKWLNNINGFYEYCLGGCGKTYDSNNTIRYNFKAINLCFECFVNKNEELANKYNEFNKCLFSDSE